MPKNESLLFLKALKEDGIEHVHVRGLAPFSAKGGQAASSSPNASAIVPSLRAAETAKQSRFKSEIAAPHKTGLAMTAPTNADIEALRAQIQNCKLCAELAKTRKQTVFGSGSLKAKLVFVGEAPGADEDEQGLPFVGRAGQLLTKIIEAMGLTRDQVFICNVLKCRPPNNRPPAPAEVAHCRPYLKQQLEIIKPRVIVALGNHAVRTLLQTEEGISGLRGTFKEYEGIPMMCTYHPAYLLRSPGEKRKVWEDMKKVMKLLDEAGE
jgi:DNA polymerase